MLEFGPIVEGYIDDAGNTGEDLLHPEQRNLFLSCVIVASTRSGPFWARCEEAWKLAGKITGVDPTRVELKGEELYGGRGIFKGVALSDRRAILDQVLDAVVSQKVYAFWEGIPKHAWLELLARLPAEERDIPLWKSVLYQFCAGVYDLCSLLYGVSSYRITADENSWIAAGHLLQPQAGKRWPKLEDRGIVVASSASTRGLQVADLVVHTLYRANKDSCPAPGTAPVALSNTDKLACSYRERLAEGRVLFNLSEARAHVTRVQERERRAMKRRAAVQLGVAAVGRLPSFGRSLARS